MSSICNNVLLEHYRTSARDSSLEGEPEQDFPDPVIDVLGAVAVTLKFLGKRCAGKIIKTATSALPSGPLSVELSKNKGILVVPVGFEPTKGLLLRQLRMPVPPRA